MRAKVWMFSPNLGGRKIPEDVREDVKRRVEKVARKNYSGRYTRLDFKFRGPFCYIDAYREPDAFERKPPKWWRESKEAWLERRRSLPTHLCRLRYFGDDRWSFCFYAYSSERYELCTFVKGGFLGKPEEAFKQSAVYLES